MPSSYPSPNSGRPDARTRRLFGLTGVLDRQVGGRQRRILHHVKGTPTCDIPALRVRGRRKRCGHRAGARANPDRWAIPASCFAHFGRVARPAQRRVSGVGHRAGIGQHLSAMIRAHRDRASLPSPKPVHRRPHTRRGHAALQMPCLAKLATRFALHRAEEQKADPLSGSASSHIRHRFASPSRPRRCRRRRSRDRRADR